MRHRPGSLALRLILAAGAWIAIALLVVGLMLSAIFRDYVVRSFDDRLTSLMDALIAVVEIDSDGKMSLTRGIGEPRFDQAYSGWYWQIAGPDNAALTSRSLWDQSLPPGEAPSSVVATRDIVGPEDAQLRLAERAVSLPGGKGRYVIDIAGDRSEIDAEIRNFNFVLVWSLLGLGFGLLIAIFLQVRYGLQPAAPHPPGHHRRAHRQGGAAGRRIPGRRSCRSPTRSTRSWSRTPRCWSARAHRSAISPMP